jgi:hypothetical protein
MILCKSRFPCNEIHAFMIIYLIFKNIKNQWKKKGWVKLDEPAEFMIQDIISG